MIYLYIFIFNFSRVDIENVIGFKLGYGNLITAFCEDPDFSLAHTELH